MQVEDIGRTSQSGSDSHKEFEKFLLIAHFLAARAACKNVPQLDTIVAKLSASLLRYSDIIPADKAFYEAGLHSQVFLLVETCNLVNVYIYIVWIIIGKQYQDRFHEIHPWWKYEKLEGYIYHQWWQQQVLVGKGARRLWIINNLLIVWF